MKTKNLITLLSLVAVFALGSCSSQKRQRKAVQKEVCPEGTASSLDLEKTGFLGVTLPKGSFPEMETYQIQVIDTTLTGGKKVSSNHLAIIFPKEKDIMSSQTKQMPLSTLCSRYDEKKGYFLTDGNTQSVVWAYGPQAEKGTPLKYKEHLKDKALGKDEREMAYAVYLKHVMFPVTLQVTKTKTVTLFQTLLQTKENGKIVSKLVFVLNMDKGGKNGTLLTSNTKGVIFEISDVWFSSVSGKMHYVKDVKPPSGTTIYKIAWNAE